MEFLRFITDQSTLILTGIIITFISSLIYTTSITGFKSGGRYRTKQGAVFIFISTTIFLGLITPLINELSKIIIDFVPLLSIMGVIIIGSNFVIHQSVPTWKHTSLKALLIYFSGILLFLIGFLLKY